MDCYDEDFYQEPGIFELLVDELKQTLKESVKEEFLQEMNRLKKENEELQIVKRDFKNIQRDYKNKEMDLKHERNNLKHEVRKERLSELLTDLQIEMYSVGYTSENVAKCDKCDEERRIYYSKPSGKIDYELCECANSMQKFEPVITTLTSFSKEYNDFDAFYEIKSHGKKESLNYSDNSVNYKNRVTSEEAFGSINHYWGVLFDTKELAQKYCDYKNAQQ